MRMQELRSDALCDVFQPARERAHHRELRQTRQSAQALAVMRCAQEMPSVHGLVELLAAALLRPGEMGRLPSQPSLLLQYRQRAERVSAVQRQRMVEDVEEAHGVPAASSFRNDRLPCHAED